MGTTRRVELPDGDLAGEAPILMPELLREMYRCGLELPANESALFVLGASSERSLSVVVRNGRDGVVDVVCSDEDVAAELRSFVGFRVALACEAEERTELRSRTKAS